MTTMQTTKKTAAPAYTERGLERLKAWGASLNGSLAPDECPSRHQARVPCATCGNTPPLPNILDGTPQGPRELRWSFWYGANTSTVAPDPLDVAVEKACEKSPEHVAAERLLDKKQSAYDAAMRALEVAIAEHDKARGERRTFTRDGMFFTTGARAVAQLERTVDDARRRLEDVELDLRRAKSDVGEHEEFRDNQVLVTRDKLRGDFR